MVTFIILVIFLGLAAALAWYLVAHDHGEKEPVLALWSAAGLGFAGALVAAVVENHLINAGSMQAGAPHGLMLKSSMAVGVIEETCKFLPLALFIYGRHFFNEHTDGVIYFALAGLGFGLPENLLYTVQFGSKAGVARLLLTPLFHAATTGTIGYFLAKRKLARKTAWPAALPLLAMMLLHGFYDFGLAAGVPLYTGISLLITLGLSGGLFFLYQRATNLDQFMGLSVAGHNAFCRACGFPNPKHHLYCTNCGEHA